MSGGRTRRDVVREAGRVIGRAVALPLAACVPGAGGGGGPAAPAAQLRKGATIVWAVDDGPTRTPLREDRVKLFKERFPDITVDFVLGATSEEKIQALFAAGTPPDLFRQEAPSMAQLATQNKIVVLDPLLR